MGRSLRFNFRGLEAKANSVDCRRGASRCVKPTRRHRRGVEVLRVRRDISGTDIGDHQEKGTVLTDEFLRHLGKAHKENTGH